MAAVLAAAGECLATSALVPVATAGKLAGAGQRARACRQESLDVAGDGAHAPVGAGREVDGIAAAISAVSARFDTQLLELGVYADDALRDVAAQGIEAVGTHADDLRAAKARKALVDVLADALEVILSLHHVQRFAAAVVGNADVMLGKKVDERGAGLGVEGGEVAPWEKDALRLCVAVVLEGVVSFFQGDAKQGEAAGAVFLRLLVSAERAKREHVHPPFQGSVCAKTRWP